LSFPLGATGLWPVGIHPKHSWTCHMTPDSLLGQSLGPYQIEAILGSGGMATVYRALAPQGETVALKTLFPPPGVGPDMLARFEREARTVAKLRHPAIVPVLDAGHAAGLSYI